MDIDVSMHRLIGELTAEVRALRGDMARVEAAAAISKQEADASLAVIHRRVDDLVSTFGELSLTVTTMEGQVRDMKPVTDDVRRWRLMGLGAIGTIGIGGMALGVTFADVVKRVLVGR